MITEQLIIIISNHFWMRLTTYFYSNMLLNLQGLLRQEEMPSLLDLIFTNEHDMIKYLSYLPPLGSSDHICIEFDLICYLEPKKSVKFKYNIRATLTNTELMKQALGNVDWVLILDTLTAKKLHFLFA